ncbi:MAG: aspartate--tRNA ligase, partial [Pseudomonadota bacterium]
MHAYRSHKCNALRATDVGHDVRLSGWVHRVRDHGGVLFIDLRDHYGITQVICDPDSAAFATAESVRAEWVIRIDGAVKARAEDLKNPKLETGDIEVYARAITVLSAADELPLPVFGELDYPEDTRLKYRFLDLRRETLHANIMLRSAVIASIRKRMTEQGFFEFQTPILTASSPEGARDFLVPSRLHKGKFYALPQAPQQFKQLCMVAGFDRYFQIAPCFRDEDPRADRSPGEFYQLDIEMSFVEQEDVFQAIEPVMRGLFEEFGEGQPVTPVFPRIPYAEAMLKYGSDKPDLRNPIEMQIVSAHFAGSGFKIFAKMLETPGNEIRAIPAPTGGSRAFCDRMNSWAQKEGLPGMGYIFWRKRGAPNSLRELLLSWVGREEVDLNERTELQEMVPDEVKPVVREIVSMIGTGDAIDRIRAEKKIKTCFPGPGEAEPVGPIAKNIGPERAEAIRAQLGLGDGDAAFFLAGDPKTFVDVAGRARNVIGSELELTDTERFDFCWIVDFPMYEWDDEAKKLDFSHNPFSMPQGGLEALTELDPLQVLGYQYDIVCNGVELSSGAIRNHKPEIMFKAFEIAGHGRNTVEERFGGMLNAFRYGA